MKAKKEIRYFVYMFLHLINLCFDIQRLHRAKIQMLNHYLIIIKQFGFSYKGTKKCLGLDHPGSAMPSFFSGKLRLPCNYKLLWSSRNHALKCLQRNFRAKLDFLTIDSFCELTNLLISVSHSLVN